MYMARIDADTATPLTGGTISFAALAEQLQGRMGGLEATFRETGETLATAIGTIDGMAEGLSAIRQSLSPDTAGVAVGKLRDVAYRLISLPMIQKRRAIEVETLTGRTRELRGLLNEVGTILKLLGIYGMNIKIASSGEAAFFNFVVGMDEKLTSGRQELRQIERQLDQFGRVVGDVQQADRLLANECLRTGSSIPTELTANANALQDHVEAVMRMTNEVGGIVRTVQGEVARVLGAIQIGDSVRQRAEHAITMLERIVAEEAKGTPVPLGATAHMARLIAAQLNAMSDEFGRELVSIVESIERLGPLADHLRELLGSQGGDDGQLLFKLEHGIATLGSVTDQLCDADGHLAELTGFVGRTLADLTDGLGRIRNIAVNVQDISTNTQLLCRRHGTLGRAVAVIAKEVAPCASRLDQLSMAVGRLITVLGAIDLVQDGHKVGDTDTRGALGEALSVVRRACEMSADAMAKGGGDARRVLSSLEASAADLAEQRGFTDALTDVARTLTRYADQVSPETPDGADLSEADCAALHELLPWAGGLYTMAAERMIHAAFLLPDMIAAAPPPIAVSFDDDDDGLF
ncbi:hypothetical protein NS258_13085 [Sphingomonas sanguinis]|uniref:ACT domain-containing protein n=2 Tax=Sphingomonas sanguinis TaxID=33051 RepID=A0A147J6H5_9SPHN|nr:hypothetical protein NS258_13085 [Sphingomonas sanguinis]